jgi:uncharacterized damage-inducible protein DinB
MNENNLYLISDTPGFTPQIGRLVSMMNHVRHTTLSAVAGLEMDELDYIHDPQSNSIGALLLHIAAAEVGYQSHTFYSCDLSKEERDEWGAALDLCEQVRAKTLSELSRCDDHWLEEETSFGSGQMVNNYFKWFHVFGHEINHRGQIRWLRSRATKGS